MMNWFQGHTDRFACLASMMGLFDLRSFQGHYKVSKVIAEIQSANREAGGSVVELAEAEAGGAAASGEDFESAFVAFLHHKGH